MGEPIKPWKKATGVLTFVSLLVAAWPAFTGTKAFVKDTIHKFIHDEAKAAAKQEVEMYMANQPQGFRGGLSNLSKVPKDRVTRWVFHNLNYIDSLRANSKFQEMAAFYKSFLPVGMFIKIDDESKWYRAPDGNLYRAYVVRDGDWKGYYKYIDIEGNAKYVFDS